jgi:hypothetical protein
VETNSQRKPGWLGFMEIKGCIGREEVLCGGPVELNTGVIITREGNKGSGVSVGLSPIAKAPW